MNIGVALVTTFLVTVCLIGEPCGAEPPVQAKEGESCAGDIHPVNCADDLWCDLRAEACDSQGLDGHCIKVPDACPKDYKPVCGCDGKTYSNDCHRKMKRIQKDRDGECTAGAASTQGADTSQVEFEERVKKAFAGLPTKKDAEGLKDDDVHHGQPAVVVERSRSMIALRDTLSAKPEWRDVVLPYYLECAKNEQILDPIRAHCLSHYRADATALGKIPEVTGIPPHVQKLADFAAPLALLPPKPGTEVTDSYVRVEIKGSVYAVVGVGGETTGTIIHVSDDINWELDFGSNDSWRKDAQALEGKPVLVKGKYTISHGIETPLRQIVKVTEFRSAAGGAKPKRQRDGSNLRPFEPHHEGK